MRRCLALCVSCLLLFCTAMPAFANAAILDGNFMDGWQDIIDTLEPEEQTEMQKTWEALQQEDSPLRQQIEAANPFLKFPDDATETGLMGVVMNPNTGESITLDETLRVHHALQNGEEVDVPDLFFTAILMQFMIEYSINEWKLNLENDFNQSALTTQQIEEQNTAQIMKLAQEYYYLFDDKLPEGGAYPTKLTPKEVMALNPEEFAQAMAVYDDQFWLAALRSDETAANDSNENPFESFFRGTEFEESAATIQNMLKNESSESPPFVYVLPHVPPRLPQFPAGVVASTAAVSAVGASMLLTKRREDERSAIEALADKVAKRKGGNFSILINEGQEIADIYLAEKITIDLPVRVENGEGLDWKFIVMPLLGKQGKTIIRAFAAETIGNTGMLSLDFTGKEIEKHQFLYCTVLAIAQSENKSIRVLDYFEVELYPAQDMAKRTNTLMKPFTE